MPVVAAPPPIAAAQAPAPPVVLAYSYAPGGIVGDRSGHRFPTRVDGVLAVPPTPGPHPVAFIFHGSYPSCIWPARERTLSRTLSVVRWPSRCWDRRHAGPQGTYGPYAVRWEASFAGMARALADRGVAAVAIDVATKENTEWGEADRTVTQRRLFDLHLRVLRSLNAGNGRGIALPAGVRGSLDLTRIAAVGHSSGGGFVLSQLEATRTRQRILPGLRAVVGVQPAAGYLTRGAFSNPVPALIIGSRCDEQIPWRDTNQVAARTVTRNGSTPTVFVGLGNTLHLSTVGGGNPRVGPTDPVETPECTTALAAPAAVRAQESALVADFVSQALSGARSFALRAGPSVPVEVRRATPGLVVTTEPTLAEGMPAEVPANRVRFRASPFRWLPPAPRRLSGGAAGT
ncbi:MAG: hypothetical protein KDC33_06810 [Thermoleophilia bacterium]|nr:hypothetical protein [Thermoleophilia bacterium]